jgi:hypothetical protein
VKFPLFAVSISQGGECIGVPWDFTPPLTCFPLTNNRTLGLTLAYSCPQPSQNRLYVIYSSHRPLRIYLKMYSGTLGTPVDMTPRSPPLRKSHKCLGYIEFSAPKLLRFTYTVCTVALSAHNLKPRGAGYIPVTEITNVHINTAHQKLDLISCSLSQILWMLDSFFPIMPPNIC